MLVPLALPVALGARRRGRLAGRRPRDDRASALYGANCASCHGPTARRHTGPTLRGAGALAADFYLRTGSMPLARAGEQPARSRVLFSEREIRALVAYVASLGAARPIPTPHPEHGSLSAGLQLFTDHCAGCHQIAARGRLRHRRARPAARRGDRRGRSQRRCASART